MSPTTLAYGHRPDPDPVTLLCRRCLRRCTTYGQDAFRHERPRCLAQMRYGERCARTAGHSEAGNGNGHRTAGAMFSARLRRAA